MITGAAAAPTQLAADDTAANVLNAFEGVELDAEAQAEIRRTLEACAERRRALENDPENDPECVFIGEAETNGYLSELESGVEGDWVEYRPEACPEQGRGSEHLWENLGEGGEAEKIDAVLAGMAERRAAKTPEQLEAEEAEHQVELQRMREARTRALPPPQEPDPPVLSEVEGDSPMLDWRNWTDEGYKPPSPLRGRGIEGEGEGKPISPRTGKPLKRYRKRTPKPPFTPPDAARKAQVLAEAEAERRGGAAAEAERRRRKKKPS